MRDQAAARIYEREMRPDEINRLRRQVMSSEEAQDVITHIRVLYAERRELLAQLKEAMT